MPGTFSCSYDIQVSPYYNAEGKMTMNVYYIFPTNMQWNWPWLYTIIVAPFMFSCNKTLILLSYHVFLWHRMRENKLKCVMCIKTHIMCFWWVSKQNFSSDLNNRSGLQWTIYHRISKKKKKKNCTLFNS